MKKALVLILAVLFLGGTAFALNSTDYRVWWVAEDGTTIAGITNTGRLDTLLGWNGLGASTLKGTFTVGVDDTGYDVKFFGATSGKYWLWDESADKMIVTGDMSISGTATVLTGGALAVTDDGGVTINSIKVSTTETVQVRIPATAAGTAGEWAAFEAPEGCEITAAYIVVDSAITGADTNYMTLSIVDKGSDGSGTTAIASVDFVSGTNAAAFDATSLGTLGAAKALAAGDVVSFKKAETGTGMDMPALLVVIQYKKT